MSEGKDKLKERVWSRCHSCGRSEDNSWVCRKPEWVIETKNLYKCWMPRRVMEVWDERVEEV